MRSEPITLSFREKSAWATLISTVLIYLCYFLAVFGRTADSGSDILTLLIAAVVVQIVAMAVIHIVFAVQSEPESTDERDVAIDLRSTRNGSVVLAVGVIFAIMLIVGHATIEDATQSSWWHLEPLMIGHGLLLCLVLSQVTTNATQVFHYRRGY